MKECIVNKQITDNLVVVNRSIKELSEVNLLLEKTINEIKENKPLTHFNSDIMLKRQLNIVKQMENTLSVYVKVFTHDKGFPKMVLVDFKYEINRIGNNHYYLQNHLEKT